ncbi:MAG: hypothetical protein ACMZ7B_06515 [Balneola sp.]
MMIRKQSWPTSFMKLAFLLPALLVVTIIYCTQAEEEVGVSTIEPWFGYQEFESNPEFVISRAFYVSGPNPIYSDTTLYQKKSEIRMNPRTYYADNGELFTGTQNWYYEKSGTLDQALVIENGIATTATRFSGDGSEFLKSVLYDQKEDTLFERSYKSGELDWTSKTWSYQDGGIIYSFSESEDREGNYYYYEFERDINSRYSKIIGYKNDRLKSFHYTDDNISTIKTYYDNGQLLNEGTAKYNGNLNYFAGDVKKHGLQVTYQENGELFHKEIWEDGELIEKIK